MKQATKNEIDLLGLMNKIQDQLGMLDKKIDSLISRSLSQIKPLLKPSVNIPSSPQQKPHDHNQGRQMHSAVCADCKKECKIPFKPSGDRPVYCQDCFSRRKVISMSGIKIEPASAVIVKDDIAPKPTVKSKKKTVSAKKSVAKKKVTPKKK